MVESVGVIGVPTDFGTNRRGVDMGPSAIRYAGLLEELSSTSVDVVDTGDVSATSGPGGIGDFATSIERVRGVADAVADRVRAQISAERIPLVLGGDHSIALGSLHGVADNADIGVIWFDAHADFNVPETSPSGNVHGMVLAAVLGLGPFGAGDWPQITGIDPENVVLVGLRDVDPEEGPLVANSDVTAFPMSAIDRDGIASVCERAVKVATTGTDGVHVSLDMDFLDPIEAPGVGTPVRGGASYREAHLAMELVSTEPLRSFEVVEVNPIRDDENQTAALATELTASAFGKRTL